jgi:hypothetical protein
VDERVGGAGLPGAGGLGVGWGRRDQGGAHAGCRQDQAERQDAGKRAGEAGRWLHDVSFR